MILTFAIIFSFTSNASASELIRTGNDESFSFYNEGKLVTVKIHRMGNSATSEVYIDGILSQKSVASLTTKTINTKVYDVSIPLRYNTAREFSKIGDFNSFTMHEPVSNVKIDEKTSSNSVKIARRSITDEPVENTGLSQSSFGGGYYYLGEYGGFSYAPNVYAKLHRKYSSRYDGETKTWRWGANETIGAISVYISLFFGSTTLVGVIVAMLFFTAQGVLAYTQSIKLATFTFYYTYMVTIKYKSYYSAWRDMTYWKIENTTAGTTKWELKSFNGGFDVSNTEMIKAGIDNYLAKK